MIRLNLSRAKGFSAHRSGWSYCIGSLLPWHSKGGLFVDDFIERTFCWDLRSYFEQKNRVKIPYRFPWVGFVHNPPDVPEWYDYYNSPNALFKRDVFLESLKTCKCLITLSEYLARWVRKRTSVPVISVRHPTGTDGKKWSPQKFLSSRITTPERLGYPKVVQIGYWLRKIDSFFKLKTPSKYCKVWLPSDPSYAMELLSAHERTKEERWGEKHEWSSTHKVDYVPDDQYDAWMSRSVVFLNLYDSCANNAVVESIIRNTPVLVNKIEPVVEYLGSDYPLYFNDIEHAERLLADDNKIIDAHLYLKNMNKEWIKGDYFAIDLIKKLKGVLR